MMGYRPWEGSHLFRREISRRMNLKSGLGIPWGSRCGRADGRAVGRAGGRTGGRTDGRSSVSTAWFDALKFGAFMECSSSRLWRSSLSQYWLGIWSDKFYSWICVLHTVMMSARLHLEQFVESPCATHYKGPLCRSASVLGTPLYGGAPVWGWTLWGLYDISNRETVTSPWWSVRRLHLTNIQPCSLPPPL